MSISLVTESSSPSRPARHQPQDRRGHDDAVVLAGLLRDDPDMLESTPPPSRRSSQPKRTGDVEPLAGEPEAGVGTTPQPDEVDASGAASFPASDPPSWWGGR